MVLRGFCLAALAVGFVGCGAAAPPAAEAPAGYPAGGAQSSAVDGSEAPAADEDSEDLTALQKRLDESERQLLAVVAPETSPSDGAVPEGGGTAGPAPKPASPMPAPTTTPPARKTPDAERRSSEVNRCDVACKALGSMRRSRDRICDLTSEDDERCTGATTRVDEASGRVTRAGCACSEP